MNKPNVLLLMTDQQRWDTLSCCGNEAIETPYLDSLAAEGTLFTNAYSCSPSCIPARASLLTGMDPWNTGLIYSTGGGKAKGMGGGFEHTLPGELAKAGYHTYGVGKMHFEPQRALNGFHHTVLDESGRVGNPGFVSDYRRWFDERKTGDYGYIDHGITWNSWMARPYHAPEFLHPTNWTVNESIRFLQQRDPEKPFFLKTSFARPHSPYDAVPYYFEMYMRKTLPKPYIGDWAGVHDVRAVHPEAWRGRRSDEEIHRARAGYYGNISHIDHQIGRLFYEMRNMGVYDNTLIIFTSDHGDMLGDHHMWRKTYGYEGSAHIPMIVRLPSSMGRSGVQESGKVVGLQDIMPTILEAVGAAVPQAVDGRSMLPLMRGEQADWRAYLHGEHGICYSEEQEMHFLTDGRWKYIWLARLGTEQLFDLAADPGECGDLAGRPEYAAELRIWRERLVRTLTPRAAGLTEGGRLVCQAGKPRIVPPKFAERMERWSGNRATN
ncbi:arylsulfatase [Paenibacillus mesophilus]|uniref:arylsulfatase n=1 Tax=Paenibacillus mesophilus TaxID=2582849 RepID=UPI00110EA65C|nr:arylsulfatase [Paenibacillus mesophilus]TMV47422.1 arylsulfatase [Paenibacillus mesophilus]